MNNKVDNEEYWREKRFAMTNAEALGHNLIMWYLQQRRFGVDPDLNFDWNDDDQLIAMVESVKDKLDAYLRWAETDG